MSVNMSSESEIENDENHYVPSPCADKSASCELCINSAELQYHFDELMGRYISFENQLGKRTANHVIEKELQRLFKSFEDNGFMMTNFQSFAEDLLAKNRPHECLFFIKYTTFALDRIPEPVLLYKCVEQLSNLYCWVTKSDQDDHVFPVLVLRMLEIVISRIQRFPTVNVRDSCAQKFNLMAAFVKRVVENGLQAHLQFIVAERAKVSKWFVSLMKSFIYHLSHNMHLSNVFYGETVNLFKEMHEPMRSLNLENVHRHFEQSLNGLRLN